MNKQQSLTTTTTTIANNNNNNNNYSIINEVKEIKLSTLLISEILKYCWNDPFAVFAWKVSLSLISKRVFKIITGLATHIDLVTGGLFNHLTNVNCIFKDVNSLSTSFKFLEQSIDIYDFEELEKNGTFVLKDQKSTSTTTSPTASTTTITTSKVVVEDPIPLLSSLSIRGPAASYVKFEKLVIQLLLSKNQASFKHFSMISHKNTLLKNIFNYLDQCTNIESFGLGVPMSEKKNTGLIQYLKKAGSNLKKVHICFNFKSNPTSNETKSLNEQLFGEKCGIDYKNLQVLELGQKRPSGPNHDSHSFDYPIEHCDILFKCVSNINRMSLLTSLIFHKPTGGVVVKPEQSLEFQDQLVLYLETETANKNQLTHLEVPIKITKPDVLLKIVNKLSLKRLVILTNQMVQFPLVSNLERLELLSDNVEKDTQEVAQIFFEENSKLPLKKLVIRDHIFFESCKPMLTDNNHLQVLNVALKGRTNFDLQHNPFLSIPDAKALKKIVAKFPHIDKGDIADAISRFLRFCSMSDSIQYVKYIQADFNLEKVNSFDFRFMNRVEKSHYYIRSLPKSSENGAQSNVICVDLKTWNGIDDQYDQFKAYITKSRKLFDQLVEQCKSRPEYSAPYLLNYTKNCLSTFSRQQWESSDEILKSAHSVVMAIMDQDAFANKLVENEHMNLEFLKKTANYLFYGLGSTLKPPTLEILENVNLNNNNNKNNNNNNDNII